jgi:hypothetical protein
LTSILIATLAPPAGQVIEPLVLNVPVVERSAVYGVLAMIAHEASRISKRKRNVPVAAVMCSCAVYVPLVPVNACLYVPART